jgi:hypothetical protein
LQLAGTVVGTFTHDLAVEFEFTATEAQSAVLVARLNEAGQGALRWLD